MVNFNQHSLVIEGSGILALWFIGAMKCYFHPQNTGFLEKKQGS